MYWIEGALLHRQRDFDASSDVETLNIDEVRGPCVLQQVLSLCILNLPISPPSTPSQINATHRAHDKATIQRRAAQIRANLVLVGVCASHIWWTL